MELLPFAWIDSSLIGLLVNSLALREPPELILGMDISWTFPLEVDGSDLLTDFGALLDPKLDDKLESLMAVV